MYIISLPSDGRVDVGGVAAVNESVWAEYGTDGADDIMTAPCGGVFSSTAAWPPALEANNEHFLLHAACTV